MPGRSRKPLQLSADDARRIAVHAQGLTDGACATPAGILRRTGAVQLDTISVLARSHELVAYARLGALPRADVEKAYWAKPAHAFEYMAHANCIIPVEDWPYFAFRRRAQAARAHLHRLPEEAMQPVRERLREGPVTTGDLGGARKGVAGWWNWSAAKYAVEMLTTYGEAVVTMRQGWRRVYDLAERAIPGKYRAADLSDEECYAYLAKRAVRAMGVATSEDIVNYYVLHRAYAGIAPSSRALLRDVIDAAGFVPAEVEGWEAPAYADHAVLPAAARAGACRTTLLSPFDSLIWDRARTKRLFGVDLKLEAYTPKAERVHGYFTMLLLHENRIVGRVDPAREKGVLVARHAHLDDRDAVEPMAAALREAATWVGCEGIRIEKTTPASLSAELRRALR